MVRELLKTNSKQVVQKVMNSLEPFKFIYNIINNYLMLNIPNYTYPPNPCKALASNNPRKLRDPFGN